jgi:hypothetical protein
VLKSRWFAGCIHAGLWVLLYLTVLGFGGNSPHFRESPPKRNAPQALPPVANLTNLFPSAPADPKLNSVAASAFATRHFIPPPGPPPPPPPTTRKVELTYLGFYQAAVGPRQAMVRIADSFLVRPVGSKLITNLFVAQATAQSLLLTNPAAQTNLLPVNIKKEVEVPIQ